MSARSATSAWKTRSGRGMTKAGRPVVRIARYQSARIETDAASTIWSSDPAEHAGHRVTRVAATRRAEEQPPDVRRRLDELRIAPELRSRGAARAGTRTELEDPPRRGGEDQHAGPPARPPRRCGA